MAGVASEVARRSPRGEVAGATGGSLVFAYAGVLLGPPGFAFAQLLLRSYTAAFGLLLVALAAAGCVGLAWIRHRSEVPSLVL